MPEQGARTDLATANVNIVRATFEAANRGDLDAWVAPLAADVEVWERDHGTVAAGREAYRRWLEHYLEAWESYSEHAEHLIPIGDQVVALVRSEACGASSQAVIQERHGEVHTVVDGRITRVALYPTHSEALASVGLDPGTVSEPEPEATDRAGNRAFSRFRWRR